MARKNFHHPFQPYDIQQEFMEAVYGCIEDGKVGIFESPTGTGKSLSLLCGSLTWLREHKRKQFDESLAGIELEDGDPEWMLEHARNERIDVARRLRADLESRLEAVRQKEKKIRQRANGEPKPKKRKTAHDDDVSTDMDDAQFLLDDYDSDQETTNRSKSQSSYSMETSKLMEKMGMVQSDETSNKIENEPEELKVFFCSRTHSQLSQLVGELKRVNLPPGLPQMDNSASKIEDLKHLTLGSRNHLCINPKVATLPSQTAINERCIEMQQSSTPADKKCQFLPKKEHEDLLLDFRDHALAKIRDIEDLANVGSKLQVCPYYGSRAAVGVAEIVTLPYPLLLQRTAREALGISLKGHVVIIDEAHNLISAVEGIHAAQISDTLLYQAKESLMIYLQKFRNRLKGSNRVYVTQVVRVIDSLLLAMSNKEVAKTSGPVEPHVLLSGKGVDQINLAKLVRYISESKLARKVQGYVAQTKKDPVPTGKAPSEAMNTDVPILANVQNFLSCLTNPAREGRFFLSQDNGVKSVQYLLLDPSEHFRDVVEDARAVILAGGTMSPMDDYKQQLLPYTTNITTMSCDHLIPASSLLVRVITSDADGPLEFTYRARKDLQHASRISQALIDLAFRSPAGMIVFFSSYSHLEQVLIVWRQNGEMSKLSEIKSVFCDSRGGSAEETFKSYSEAVRTNANGALLLSVIGGKLSEGINFSDELGRCVVVVGLPFPNLETPEWRAKMQYLDEKAIARGQPKGSASRDHAENICMRSVNQAIGRVIRHKDDWASIVLLDSRYRQERIRGKLPRWIKKSLPEYTPATIATVESAKEDLLSFFADRARWL